MQMQMQMQMLQDTKQINVRALAVVVLVSLLVWECHGDGQCSAEIHIRISECG